MKFVAISDTHGKHYGLDLPPADAIIHAGDVSGNGKADQIIDFLKWFGGLDYQYKVFIAGNHDWFFERYPDKDIQSVIPSNVIYLNDSAVKIGDINLWGSPISPFFFNWAFNRRRGAEIKKHWDKIPSDTDILITHGPPHKILDRTDSGDYAGCADLMDTIKVIQPKVHIFGHIHEGYGMLEKNGTTFINASSVNAQYKLVNEPVEFEL